jgi:hypothetical protein
LHIYQKTNDMKEQFNKDVNDCIEVLNRLLQSEYISKNDRYMLRINRFKRWVLDIIVNIEPTSNNIN